MSKVKTYSAPYPKPSRALLWTETSRAALDSMSFWAALPRLAAAPKGDGQEVLVLPGLTADDSSTAVMRSVIASRGYPTHGWGLGPNLGPTRRIIFGLLDTLDELYEKQGRPISLVGWSLGGILARVIAKHHGDKVRNVVSLGSPIHLTVETSPLSSHAGPIFEALRPWHTQFLDYSGPEDKRMMVHSPATSVYSKLDGVVPWESCLDLDEPQRENVEVTASHMGMGMNPQVLSIVLDRLRQPEGAWEPYEQSKAKTAAA